MHRDIPMLHPGAILREEFLEPMELSAYALAKANAALSVRWQRSALLDHLAALTALLPLLAALGAKILNTL